jgi:hypothetical protein
MNAATAGMMIGLVAAGALAQPMSDIRALAAPGPRTISISSDRPLQFGAFAAGPVGGTVTISPLGARSAAGVFPIGNDPFGPASFTVTISQGQPQYTILLPASAVLVSENGSATMTIDGFSSDPAGSGKTPAPNRPGIMTVGATLHVGMLQAPGNYSGTFPVTVDLAN